MKRWLAVWILLAGASGCGMMDDWIYDDAPTVYHAPVATYGSGAPSCGVVPVGFNKSQTQEPDLLRAK